MKSKKKEDTGKDVIIENKSGAMKKATQFLCHKNVIKL